VVVVHLLALGTSGLDCRSDGYLVVLEWPRSLPIIMEVFQMVAGRGNIRQPKSDGDLAHGFFVGTNPQ
jgi:hypothetical protein